MPHVALCPGDTLQVVRVGEVLDSQHGNSENSAFVVAPPFLHPPH